MNTELKLTFVALPFLLFSIIDLPFYGNHIVEDAEVNSPENVPMVRKVISEFVPIWN